MKATPPAHHRQRQSGSAILVLLTLLSIATLLAVSNHLTLRHLLGELKLLEFHQRQKYLPVRQLNPTNTVAIKAPIPVPALTNGSAVPDLNPSAK
jgi:hypothetical protein